MRQTLRLIAVLCLSLLSLDVAVSLLDWTTRWEWLEGFMAAHPRTDHFVHTPIAYLFLLVAGFASLRAEKWLKQPRIVARFVNSRIFPNLRKTTVRSMFNEGKPGAELEKLNWEWFSEIRLANDAETPTTIEDVEVRVRVGHKWWFKESVKVEHIKDMQAYKIDRAMDYNGNSIPLSGATRYSPVPSLLARIQGQPLTKGIGHAGWLRFDVEQVSRQDINKNRVHLDVWLIDALDGKHGVMYRRDSDKDWDKSFLIFEDDTNSGSPDRARRL